MSECDSCGQDAHELKTLLRDKNEELKLLKLTHDATREHYENFKHLYCVSELENEKLNQELKEKDEEIELLNDHRKNNCHWKSVAIRLTDKEIPQLKQELKAERESVDYYANGNGGDEEDSEFLPACKLVPFAGDQLGKLARETQKNRRVIL